MKKINALNSAIKRAEKNLGKLHSTEQKYSAFRLVFTIGVLAVLVAFFGSKSHDYWLLAALVFMGVFFILAFFHQKIKRNQNLWNGLLESYILTKARFERNFKKIAEHSKYEKEKFSQKNKFKNNLYSFDLDVFPQLFFLLNSCTTKQGSEFLWNELNTRGANPLDLANLQNRIQRINELCVHTRTLRYFEAYKYTQSFLDLEQKIFKEPDQNETETKNVNEEKSKKLKEGTLTKLNQVLKFIFCGLFLFGWILLVPSSTYLYFQTQDLAVLTKSFTFILFMLILSPFLFARDMDDFKKITSSFSLFFEISRFIKTRSSCRLPYSVFKADFARHFKLAYVVSKTFEFRQNPFFSLLIHIIIPLDALVYFFLLLKQKFFAVQIEIIEKECIEFDFLSALARFKNENPEFHFSHVQQDSHIFKAVQMGHPLIPASKRVCNDFSFEEKTNVVLLTGSNMAGKSTFLRTIGLNILLSNMGAPTCCREFYTPQLSLLCSIRIDDSLEEGSSYFYAEVKRLKKIVDAVEQGSAFSKIFLVDEIFKGTNNKERFIGSFNIIKSLSSKNQFGLVTTHDLSLVKLESENTKTKNMHFRETISDNKLHFDFILRNGPCETSNALVIMKNEGLPLVEVTHFT